jgi:hypothetical protein
MPETSLPALQSDDRLGRRVFSQGKATQLQKGRKVHEIFMPPPGRPRLSVDRLNHAETEVMVVVVARTAGERATKFQGWSVVTVVAIESEKNCLVIESGQPDNPFHADIVLPDSVIEDKDVRKAYATRLAAQATFMPVPLPPESA